MPQGGGAQNQQNQQPQAARGFSFTSVITQLLLFWMVSNLIFRRTDTTEDPNAKNLSEADLNQPIIIPDDTNINTNTNNNNNNNNIGNNNNNPQQQKDIKIPCLFRSDADLVMKLYITENQDVPPIYNSFFETPFILSKQSKYHIDFNLTTTPHMQNNGSSYFHVLLAEKEFFNTKSKDKVFTHIVHPMNVFKLQDKFVQRQNLITGELNTPDLTKENINEERKIISFWKPQVTLSLVELFYPVKRNAIPEPLRKHIVLHKSGNAYHPIIYINQFWDLDEHLIPINDTVDIVPLTVYFDPLTITWFSVYQQFEESFRMQESIGSTKREIDDVKLMLLDTNPYFLGLTIVVSLLHTVFDFLAFKNDITFWKNKKDLKGLSIKSIFWNVISQLIVFLYLFDNDTSFLILVSAGIGIVIECWKITKAVNVSVEWRGGFPMLKFQDKESYVSETKEYDDLAFKWLSRLLFPLVIVYSIYSLYYDTHKSWYSWILASLTGCVYTFGFIMMTPQLFINYKLKSVAHLPWRTFTYKALNTFIDDMFAFIIRMPTLHRLSCFRDDIVFFIFLYQRYIYPVDKRRMNEFGGTGLDAEDEKENNRQPPAEEKKDQ